MGLVGRRVLSNFCDRRFFAALKLEFNDADTDTDILETMSARMSVS